MARAVFVAALLPILGAILVVSATGRFASNAPVLIPCLLAGGVAWLGAVALALRGSGDCAVVLVGSLALRLLAFSGEPALSDDIYRYLWEGEVILAGANPYTTAPDDSAVAELAELQRRLPELHSRVNHREVGAAHPPLSQAAGTAAAALGQVLDLAPEKGGVRLLRAFFGLCDLLVLWPLTSLLRRARLPTSLCVVWGWCPLSAIEFAGSGHHDSLGILLFLAALAVGGTSRTHGEPEDPPRRRWLAMLAWSGSILTKYVPLVAAPWFARGRGGLRRIAIAALFCAVGFLPFLLLHGGDVGLFSGLSQYVQRWDASSLVHRWIEAAFDPFFRRDETWTDPRRLARGIACLAWLAYAVTVAKRIRDPAAGSARLIGAWLVLSPTLHPWYLTWMLPFLALRTSFAWAWLALVAPLLYWPLPRWQAEGVWSEPAWLWPVVALPFFALLLLDGIVSGRQRRLLESSSP